MTQEKEQALRINLEDAGCSVGEIERFLELAESGNVQEQQKYLQKHRRALLDAMHRDQRQIDCLDYLIYQTKGEKAK